MIDVSGPSSCSTQPCRILLIEDDYVDQESIRRVLEVTEQEYRVSIYGRLEHGLRALRSGPFDAVILDLNLPDSVGEETIRAIYEEFPTLPIVVLTGQDGQFFPPKFDGIPVESYLVKGEVTGATIARTVQAVAKNLSN